MIPDMIVVPVHIVVVEGVQLLSSVKVLDFGHLNSAEVNRLFLSFLATFFPIFMECVFCFFFSPPAK